MTPPRIVCQFSCGAASAVATKLALAQYGTTLTVCCLTLRNGYTVVGESAAASPDNFDEAMGRKIARQHARDKIWALEGYALREKLAA